jgi:hypothetical protein
MKYKFYHTNWHESKREWNRLMKYHFTVWYWDLICDVWMRFNRIHLFQLLLCAFSLKFQFIYPLLLCQFVNEKEYIHISILLCTTLCGMQTVDQMHISLKMYHKFVKIKWARFMSSQTTQNNIITDFVQDDVTCWYHFTFRRCVISEAGKAWT